MKEDKFKDEEVEESEETPEDESSESEATQESEAKAGTEQHTSEGVKVPEEFQKQSHALLESCSDRACLSYLRDCVNYKEEEMRKTEASQSKGKGKSVPDEYSTAEMPA